MFYADWMDKSILNTKDVKDERRNKEMEQESILYCFMNKNFEFTDERDNPTDDLKEAAGFSTLEQAKKYRDEFDEPQEWKIVKKKIIYRLEEIVEE